MQFNLPGSAHIHQHASLHRARPRPVASHGSGRLTRGRCQRLYATSAEPASAVAQTESPAQQDGLPEHIPTFKAAIDFKVWNFFCHVKSQASNTAREKALGFCRVADASHQY